MAVIPAEWSPQYRLWTCWPSHPGLWPGQLLQVARDEVSALVRTLAASTACAVLAFGDESRASAHAALEGHAEIIPARFGDIWLRDTGPVFISRQRCLRFATNGWGGKYPYEFDDEVGDTMARLCEAEITRHHFVLEGGSLDHNGEGHVLTTRECLLNANRNQWREAEAEKALHQALGCKRVHWLDKGLRYDHTDGHVDNLARFVSPDTVVCQAPHGDDDPNAEIYRQCAETLRAQGLRVARIPSPGLVRDPEGAIMPASHLNFIISNDQVVVPTYNSSSREAAIAGLAELFPAHRVTGLPANALLTGGGSFHCITQQQPL